MIPRTRHSPPDVFRRAPHCREHAPQWNLHAVVAFCFILLLFIASCTDRLPTAHIDVKPPVDTISVNSFILDGGGYRNALFNLSATPARAYYFPADSLTSIWKADLVVRSGGPPVEVVVLIGFPGNGSGTFPWENALVDPNARSRVVLRVGTTEYSSVSGGTSITYHSDGTRITLRGRFSGVLRSRAQEEVMVRDGRFVAEFF